MFGGDGTRNRGLGVFVGDVLPPAGRPLVRLVGSCLWLNHGVDHGMKSERTQDKRVDQLSLVIYLLLVLLLVLIKLSFSFFPVRFRAAGQESAFLGKFSWASLSPGSPVFGVQTKRDFPSFLDSTVTNVERFLVPIVAGIIYGIITIWSESRHSRVHPLSLEDDVHVEFPLSVPFYIYGGIFLEIFLRLFSLSVIVWLLGLLGLNGSLEAAAVGIGVVIVALYEPWPYMKESFTENGWTAAARLLVGHLFIANLVAGIFMCTFGFLAPLTMRLGFYAIWHVSYGGLLARKKPATRE